MARTRSEDPERVCRQLTRLLLLVDAMAPLRKEITVTEASQLIRDRGIATSYRTAQRDLDVLYFAGFALRDFRCRKFLYRLDLRNTHGLQTAALVCADSYLQKGQSVGG